MPEQADLFWKGRTGEQLRDHALKKFEVMEGAWLDRARAMIFQLCHDGAYDVSSDDVWRFCPPPADVHPSVMGAVFKHARFAMTGWKASTRPSAHARVIRTYRLRGDNE